MSMFPLLRRTIGYLGAADSCWLCSGPSRSFQIAVLVHGGSRGDHLDASAVLKLHSTTCTAPTDVCERCDHLGSSSSIMVRPLAVLMSPFLAFTHDTQHLSSIIVIIIHTRLRYIFFGIKSGAPHCRVVPNHTRWQVQILWI